MTTKRQHRNEEGRPISLNSHETEFIERPKAGKDIEITVKSGIIRIAVKQSKNAEDIL